MAAATAVKRHMKQGLMAPQFGVAARRAADGDDSPELEPTAPNVLAHSGASAFRPAPGPTVIVKTVKRRKLEIGAADKVGAGLQENSMDGSMPQGGADSLKTPKVFRLAPAQPTPALEDSGRTES